MASSKARTFARIGSTEPPTGAPRKLDTAIVLGGSVAGLMAARVLADHARTVVVVERDDLTQGGSVRRGVPQGSQVHALLPGGNRQMERWFPGFTTEAVAAGAVRSTAEQRDAYIDGVRKVRGSEVDMLTATRPLFEDQLRRRLLALPNVKTITGRATGLDFSDSSVTAVRYESDGMPGVQPASFVVDAMGRSSRLSDWLEAGGWDRPPMTRQITGINYATALFRRPPGEPDRIAAIALCSPEVGGDLAGVTFSAVEDDRWIVMMGGYGDCRPGHDAEDMIRRCRHDFPAEFGQVAGNDLVRDVVTYRQADSRRRDFAATNRFPARLVAVGDAVASFNPIYGQGMSSAALHSSCLDLFLRSEHALDAPARHFFDLQQVVVDAAWGISTGGDLGRPSVDAPRPRGYRVTSWLTGQIVGATITDPWVGRLFDDVTHMVRHPDELAAPAVLGRALAARFSRRPAPTAPLATTA
ncbi:FAD-dependent oxidoreductase [Actinoplanes sp. NBRC 103695]|uniref:FAD-dependent oxidoreductase n=1 Tax=Actinoplanes sp. NBRC 103695 TaxID=3032202 RepID=UPI0024A0774E|nr:FAD-dependent oxidoreductase [Actinoplanes sp. NBRC 103695]GLY95526.1 hydroxylase [Actinoplanes sp. NBRC 103695]